MLYCPCVWSSCHRIINSGDWDARRMERFLFTHHCSTFMWPFFISSIYVFFSTIIYLTPRRSYLPTARRATVSHPRKQDFSGSIVNLLNTCLNELKKIEGHPKKTRDKQAKCSIISFCPSYYKCLFDLPTLHTYGWMCLHIPTDECG